MADREPLPLPDDPREWLPMRAYRGRRRFDIKDPILEPLWGGSRVLAHVTIDPEAEPAAEVALIEELGADVAGELPELVRALGQGALVLDAVIDGVITRQVGLDGLGAAAIPEVKSRPTEMFVRGNLDFDVTARGPVEAAAAEAEETALDGFVAVDLLRIDGTSLLDVPLLERKRLLESIIAPGPLLRFSPHVRPPIDPWIATWKSMGLRGGILKAANSRYHPADDTVEWRIVERLNRRS
jgi:bifunctional non-homologous end joining protein LigD